jgi:hypothetical protein
MVNPEELEHSFKEFNDNLQKWVPDGVLPVNLTLLHELGLLDHAQFEQGPPEQLMHYFHVIETPDKVTLFNDQFAVWIMPKVSGETSSTLTFIALLHQNKPHLEIVFSTAGVYNTPRHILKVLQHFITEVIDTEATISSIDDKPKDKP